MIIGLTGGIGSGKSTVARAFGTRGIGWVDADDIAREVVKPGEPALHAISERYDPSILHPNGELDRAALRAIVFAEPKERAWLEAQTHPRIRQRLIERLDELLHHGSPYVLLVSPLLFESGQHTLVERALVVDVPQELQLARTQARDGVSHEQASAIIAAQLPRDVRNQRADDIIDNSGDENALNARVAALDARYRQLAAHRTLS